MTIKSEDSDSKIENSLSEAWRELHYNASDNHDRPRPFNSDSRDELGHDG